MIHCDITKTEKKMKIEFCKSILFVQVPMGSHDYTNLAISIGCHCGCVMACNCWWNY